MSEMNWIDALEKQILSIAVGGCTCNTKSPDLTFHAPHCHYLKASNALGMVEELRDERSEVLDAALGMKRIVEEIDGAMNHGTWRDESGARLKDTPEWVALYNAL